MGNTKYRSDLCKSSFEKRAGIMDYLAKTSYGKNFMRKLYNPIQEKGFLGGVGKYLGDQLIPKSYATQQKVNLENLNLDLAELMKNKPSFFAGSAIKDPFKAKVKALKDEIQQTQLRHQRWSDPKGSPYSTLWASMNNPALSRGERWSSAKELLKPVGHYGLESMNLALMSGLPIYSLYEAANAPQGQRAKALGSALGEFGGLLSLGPIGVIPSIAAMPLGGHLGKFIGGEVGELVSPTTTYEKMKQYVRPYTPGLMGVVGKISKNIQDHATMGLQQPHALALGETLPTNQAMSMGEQMDSAPVPAPNPEVTMTPEEEQQLLSALNYYNNFNMVPSTQEKTDGRFNSSIV